MHVVTTRRAALAGAALLPWAAAPARAQAAWPSRTVRWIFPFPPGGGVDVVARLITARLTETVGRPFIVDNVAGGSGVIGSSAAARAEPDGHTLLLHTYSTAVVNPVFMANLPYDPVAAFAPVSLLAVMPMMIVVNPQVPARTVAEFVALAKASPGRLTYGTSGPRTAPHLASELFRLQAGLDMLHVPYRGTGPAALALLSGEINMLVDTIAAQREHIQAGRARPLAMLGRTRSPLLPDVPTLAESGLPDYDFSFWAALFGPAGLPSAIAERQAEVLRAAVNEPALAARLADLGVEPKASSPAELDRFFRAELAATRGIVERARIPAE